MNSTYSISKGQRAFPQLVREAEEGGMPIVTRHERPVAYLVSAQRMQALLETIELLSNPAFRSARKADASPKAKLHGLDAIPD